MCTLFPAFHIKRLIYNLFIWKATYICHSLIWIISYFGYIYQKECVLYKKNRVRVTQIRISCMHAFLYFVFLHYYIFWKMDVYLV